MVKIQQFIVNAFQENCFVAADPEKGRALVVDPGMQEEREVAKVKEFIASKGLTPDAILLTHGHFDHIYGVAELQREYGCPVYMSAEDRFLFERVARDVAFFGMPVPDTSFETTAVADGEEIEAGGLTLRVIATPGHTPGCVCYHCPKEGVLFTGDTLFAGAIGRTDLGGYGDYDKLIVSVMDKVMGLDTDTDIFPGHGGCSSIGHERTHNPFLQPFNEKDPDSDEVEGIEIHG